MNIDEVVRFRKEIMNKSKERTQIQENEPM